MNLKPTQDRIIVQPDAANEMTKGGIIIPDQAKEQPKRGLVIAVGPGKYNEERKRIPLDIEVGDRVVYSKYTGTVVKADDGSEFIIMNESDILAKA